MNLRPSVRSSLDFSLSMKIAREAVDQGQVDEPQSLDYKIHEVGGFSRPCLNSVGSSPVFIIHWKMAMEDGSSQANSNLNL